MPRGALERPGPVLALGVGFMKVNITKDGCYH